MTEAEGQVSDRQGAGGVKATIQIGDASALAALQPGVAAFDRAMPLAFELGWTMAVLYEVPTTESEPRIIQLPSEHELPAAERRQLEIVRLNFLLGALAKAVPGTVEPIPTSVTKNRDDQVTGTAGPVDGMHIEPSELEELNLRLLKSSVGTRELGCAYSLGRSLRTTIRPAEHPAAPAAENVQPLLGSAALQRAFRRERISIIQQWLAMLAPHFPASTSAIVSTSLGWWCEFVNAAFDPDTPETVRRWADKEMLGREILQYLLRQGDAWLDLLTGAQLTAGLLSPEAYAQAGERALDRSARIVSLAAKHFWYALAVVGAALGGLSYLAIADLQGAARVWTEIASIVGSLGISARGLSAAAGRLAVEGIRPVYALEEVDLMAWSVTVLPRAQLTHGAVAMLRSMGVPRGPAHG